MLVAIERAGVRVDGAALAGQSQRIDRELAARSAQIFEIAGEASTSIRRSSSRRFCSTSCSCRRSSATRNRRRASTAVEVLEELALTHELPRLILEWRALQKLKGTYVDALPELVNPETGRVHTCFNQAVAATGRLSSSDPNLQNIPIRTELGREIRRAFIADPGHVLISADYSQIELRVLAHLAEEEALIEAFQAGEDIHDRTALKVFGATAVSTPTSCAAAPRSSTTRCSMEKPRSRWPKTSASRRRRHRNSSTPTSRAFRACARSSIVRCEDARASGVVKTLYGRRGWCRS